MYTNWFIVFVDRKPTSVLQGFPGGAQRALPGLDRTGLTVARRAHTHTAREGKCHKNIQRRWEEKSHCYLLVNTDTGCSNAARRNASSLHVPCFSHRKEFNARTAKLMC